MVYKIFRSFKKIFVGVLSFSGSSATKCMSLNDKNSKIRPFYWFKSRWA